MSPAGRPLRRDGLHRTGRERKAGLRGDRSGLPGDWAAGQRAGKSKTVRDRSIAAAAGRAVRVDRLHGARRASLQAGSQSRAIRPRWRTWPAAALPSSRPNGCCCSRRRSFDPGTGHHELWLTTGSRAGDHGLWELDVDEGVAGVEPTGEPQSSTLWGRRRRRPSHPNSRLENHPSLGHVAQTLTDERCVAATRRPQPASPRDRVRSSVPAHAGALVRLPGRTHGPLYP